MKFNFKKTLIVIVLVLLILSCYFYMHFPIGTFNYSNGKNREFSIKIQISEQLGTMFEPVYNLSVIIQSDNPLTTNLSNSGEVQVLNIISLMIF
jgi:hypothetical protein